MKLFKNKTRVVFLDYASTSPVDEKVLDAMIPYFSKKFYNANSLYTGAVEVQTEIEKKRKEIASFFTAHSDEIIFTRGGTESDNLAILGVLKSFKKNNPDLRPHMVTSNIEHPAVRETLLFLEKTGEIELTQVEVDSKGLVEESLVYESLRPETILVSVIYASNEIGVIQDVRQIAKIVRKFKKHKLNNVNSKYPLLHTDACQAVQFLNTNVLQLGVDLLTCSGSKIYGPKGIGLLFVKRQTPIEKIFYGGGQEFGLRPGTQDTASIVGFAKALKIVKEKKDSEFERLSDLQIYCLEKLKKEFSEIMEVNGSMENRLPNNLNITLKGLPSELIVLELDARGVYVSSKSACKSDDPEESYVLKALNKKIENEEQGNVRISFGRETGKREVDILVSELADIVEKYRKSGLYKI